MARYPYRKAGNAWDRIFRNNYNQNLSDIESDIRDSNTALDTHKKAKTAHTSEQIDHGGFSVANRIKNLYARFANLVLNHDGTSIKELIDIRVAMDATIHPTAKDRLDYDFNKVDQAIKDATVLISLKPYLRKHDGDFTKAMQDVLDQGETAPVWVVVPPGSYVQNGTIRIYRNTRLTIQAGATIKRNFVGSMFVNGDASDSFTGYNGHGNIVIEGGGAIDSAGADIKKQCSVFSFAHADGIVIRDLTITDVCGGHAFDCAGNQNVLIDNVKFKGFADYAGDRWFSEAIQIDLMRAASNFGAFGAYDNTVTRNIIVQNCYFGKSTKLGGWPRALGSHTSTDGFHYSVIRFLNNTVEDSTEWAISGNKWQDVLISGNKFNNCASGVRTLLPTVDSVYTRDADGNPTGRVNKVKHQIISENIFTNIKVNHAIQAYGRKGYQTIDDVSIFGNVIDGVTARHGIHVSDVRNFVVDDNILENVAHHAILITRSSYGSVSSNTARSIKGNGVRLEEGTCNNVTVAHNALENIGYSGISVSGVSKRVQVSTNTILNAGTRTTATSGYDGIIFMEGVTRSKCVFNDITGTTMRYGIYLSGACSYIQHFGNYTKGAGSVASYNDKSDYPITSPNNVV
ncbi:right-handed parallel beta-helix repeat-containing protein [Bacillus haynesii]|uniref:right-handed parallel beta-helix repeat-containing protein n=1 Tax=Bacillus haynesii TaxID=1925021 RepID=UPI002DB9315C|nr:right-handed parallel beta-helix repeat-containing protein [Bacillus haynesii]MEC1507107.1 right-handed parallel beta-helix repeat-containing protein [Bacillus haynesii]